MPHGPDGPAIGRPGSVAPARGFARWRADVTAFLGSRDIEQGPEVPWVIGFRPSALPGETFVRPNHGACRLFRVDDPPCGWRPVGWTEAARSACQVRELPAYTPRDARILVRAFLDDYLE